MCSKYPGIKLETAPGRYKKTKLNICDHILSSSTQLQNRSFYVIERTRTSSKCQKMKNARAKRAKILFFIVKYANLWVFCCLSSSWLLKLSIIRHHVESITIFMQFGSHGYQNATNLSKEALTGLQSTITILTLFCTLLFLFHLLLLLPWKDSR